MSFITILRKNIGTIIACLGFIFLCIMTFGDLGELFGDTYWQNVKQNITAISFVSIGLTFTQTAIKQGLAEQALQRGLNTEKTTLKMQEHKDIIAENNNKMVYLPYFLQVYNKRHTKLRKHEYLVNNNYCSEKSLYASDNKKLIKEYEKIVTHITASSIKWSTVEVVYNKNGQIMTLDEHRKRRLASSIITSLGGMVGVTFLAGGLFFSPSGEPLWQKFVKLFTYCVTIAIGGVFTVIKEYEKGAFGVPNDLDEINQIWHEFKIWEVPDWVTKEVEELNREDNINEEVRYEQEKQSTVDIGTNIQKEQKDCESVRVIESHSVIPISDVNNNILCFNGKE